MSFNLFQRFLRIGSTLPWKLLVFPNSLLIGIALNQVKNIKLSIINIGAFDFIRFYWHCQ